jgi:hypothetical protein
LGWWADFPPERSAILCDKLQDKSVTRWLGKVAKNPYSTSLANTSSPPLWFASSHAVTTTMKSQEFSYMCEYPHCSPSRRYTLDSGAKHRVARLHPLNCPR